MAGRQPWWLLVLAAFVAFLVLVGLARSDEGAREFFRIFAIPSALVIGGLVLTWYQRRKAIPFGEGYRLLQRGRLAEALTQFERYHERHPSEPSGPFYLGITRLQLWQLEAASQQLEKAWMRRRPGENEGWHLAVLSLCNALGAQTERAREWLAQRRDGDLGEGERALAEAILLARSSDWPSAREKLARLEVKHLAGVLGALARTVDAFCIERLSGELRHVDRVALFAESGPQGLQTAWPELIDFVERAPGW